MRKWKAAHLPIFAFLQCLSPLACWNSLWASLSQISGPAVSHHAARCHRWAEKYSEETLYLENWNIPLMRLWAHAQKREHTTKAKTLLQGPGFDSSPGHFLHLSLSLLSCQYLPVSKRSTFWNDTKKGMSFTLCSVRTEWASMCTSCTHTHTHTHRHTQMFYTVSADYERKDFTLQSLNVAWHCDDCQLRLVEDSESTAHGRLLNPPSMQ